MWLDILEYYKNLLIVQYRAKAKARGMVGVVANSSVCDGLLLQLKDAFNLDSAYGNQLTILGKIVGVPRDIIGLDLSHTFFSLTRYDSTPASVGFGRYNSQPDSNLFLRYNENATYTLSDFELRNLIKLKIIYNSRYATHKAIKDGLYTYFQGDIDIVPSIDSQNIWFTLTRYNGTPASIGFGRYTDSPYNDGQYLYRYRQNRNMQITYAVKSLYYSTFESAKYLRAVPCAMGVTINTVYT